MWAGGKTTPSSILFRSGTPLKKNIREDDIFDGSGILIV